jgi:arylsulfatase A-like enzyme
MRIVYIDIDTQRADHLGCYGYHRNTSPTIDAIAREGLRYERCYASDTPCLPSRTALTTGRFGIRNGAINHGGVAADHFIEGPNRQFRAKLNTESFVMSLRHAGLRTATVSTFGERHSSLHWYAGYNEVVNIGGGGMESAHEVMPEALAWLDRNQAKDGWFLHVHLWDPHTPYRAPASYGEPFAKDPLPKWLTEEVRQQHWNGFGPHSAQEVMGYGPYPEWEKQYPRQPQQIASMDDVRRMFDGYDTGTRYADDHIAQLVAKLKQAGIYDQTAIMISADHGETLGELNIYGDHQTADELTNHVPMILRWPGVTDRQAGKTISGLNYQFDVAATVIELAGGQVPSSWDGVSHAAALRAGRDAGRDHLVLSQGAWSCQRSVRWDRWLCIRSYHDGYHGFPDVMLFDLVADPHEQHDVAAKHPELVRHALAQLDAWHADMMRKSSHAVDPMWTVLREGGPYHTRGALPGYAERLRKTGRAAAAEKLMPTAKARAVGA